MERNSKGGRGRRKKQDVAERRFTARQYLSENYPASAAVFDQMQSGELDADEFFAKLDTIIQEGQQSSAVELGGLRDAISTNPEQSLARALNSLGIAAAQSAACDEVISILDAQRDALVRERDHLDRQESKLRNVIVEAAVQRPRVDREVMRRAFELELAGATRSNFVRMKQRADAMWEKPEGWQMLVAEYGRMKFEDTPRQNDPISKELLPPRSSIDAYLLEPAAFEAGTKGQSINARARTYCEELQKWIALHYPGPRPRDAEVMARAWVGLIMRKDQGIQASDLWVNALLPSAWTPNKVMTIRAAGD